MPSSPMPRASCSKMRERGGNCPWCESHFTHAECLLCLWLLSVCCCCKQPLTLTDNRAALKHIFLYLQAFRLTVCIMKYFSNNFALIHIIKFISFGYTSFEAKYELLTTRSLYTVNDKKLVRITHLFFLFWLESCERLLEISCQAVEWWKVVPSFHLIHKGHKTMKSIELNSKFPPQYHRSQWFWLKWSEWRQSK